LRNSADKQKKEKHNKNMIFSVEIITKVQVQRVIACEYTYECIMLWCSVYTNPELSLWPAHITPTELYTL